MLQVSLLGPLEVRRDGEVVSIPGGKTAEVLVRLALDAGVLVRTDRLVEDLWADDAVTTSRNTLQSKIAKLRRALASAPELISGDGGYLLEVDPAEVDAFAVPRDAAAAARLLAAGDDRRAPPSCPPRRCPCSMVTCCPRPPATGRTSTGPDSRKRERHCSTHNSRLGCASARLPR